MCVYIYICVCGFLFGAHPFSTPILAGRPQLACALMVQVIYVPINYVCQDLTRKFHALGFILGTDIVFQRRSVTAALVLVCPAVEDCADFVAATSVFLQRELSKLEGGKVMAWIRDATLQKLSHADTQLQYRLQSAYGECFSILVCPKTSARLHFQLKTLEQDLDVGSSKYLAA